MAGLATAMAVSSFSLSGASSHREAPLISQDPVADNTDTYAFVAPDAPSAVTMVANWIPLEAPNGGPNFYRFGDDVLYTVEVDNNGDAVPDVEYQFRFHTVVKNPNTYLYNTGPVTSLSDKTLNIHQYYSVTEVKNGKSTTLASNLEVAPPNIGPRSTPNYAKLAKQATYTLPGGIKVFAGPRDDPFFVDLGSIFDLGGLRPLNKDHVIPLPTAAGKDGLKGKNVHSIVIQVPKKDIVTKSDPVVGVWSDTYRRRTRVLSNNGTSASSGPWVQVSRLGMPLVNEVVIPVGKKDLFNASDPVNDSQFGSYVENPELAGLIPVLYPGVKVPPNPRMSDIVPIFLTGIPGLNMPKHVKPAEMIRLNTSIKPTPWNKQNRLGLLAGQQDGFPNGRRLVDDVTDIELRALAGGTPFTPSFNHFPNNALTDGVDKNDVPFLTSFPYVASPHDGYSAS
ncbi:MAG TPA: DUF4331 domain-containing protein [Acidimicrobiia bacterium]